MFAVFVPFFIAVSVSIVSSGLELGSPDLSVTSLSPLLITAQIEIKLEIEASLHKGD